MMANLEIMMHEMYDTFGVCFYSIAETPRILRSSKRKASDDSPAGAFSAAKRYCE